MADNAPQSESSQKNEPPPAAPSGGGGIGAWLPLIVTVLVMPAMAYAMTSFVLLPKMKAELAAVSGNAPTADTAPAKPAAPTHASGGHGESSKPSSRNTAPTGPVKSIVPLSKILVNVAGTMGSRYLLCSVSLASEKPGFEQDIKSNEPKLIDLAGGILSSKTVADLEKTGARNQIRAELITMFNNELGAGSVKDIYFTEFAIQ